MMSRLSRKPSKGGKPPKLGKKYPEQSARQALWSFRRKQGGPGLTEGTADPKPRFKFELPIAGLA